MSAAGYSPCLCQEGLSLHQCRSQHGYLHVPPGIHFCVFGPNSERACHSAQSAGSYPASQRGMCGCHQ